MTSIVGVHGVGNHLPELAPAAAAAALGRTWSKALARCVGIEDEFELAVAYYAHHLRTSLAHGVGDGLDGLDEEASTMLRQWDESLREDRPVPQGWLTWPVRQIVSGIVASRAGGDAMRAFIPLGLREVQLFLGARHRARRVLARDAVAATIRDRGASVVLAHSLGSVVAYEALWAHPDLTVDLLVTMGSPLGIRGMVLDRLEPGNRGEDNRVLRPPGVRRWVNIADPGDLFAVPRWLRKTFAVDHELETAIGVFDFHRVSNYLACAELGAALRRRV